MAVLVDDLIAKPALQQFYVVIYYIQGGVKPELVPLELCHQGFDEIPFTSVAFIVEES